MAYICGMHKQINSLQNPSIKRLLQLQEKSRARKKEGRFIVEGAREIGMALKGAYTLEEVFYCPEIFPAEELEVLIQDPGSVSITEIPVELYEKIAYRGSTEGIIGVGVSRDLGLEKLKLQNPNPLILVAEAPEKPGNIGALLRTADAARLDAVLIANPKTDLFNPNIIRSSLGCLFTNNIAIGTTTEIISFLKKNNIAMYGAALQASVPYHSIDFNSPSAIVVGTEASGLSDEWMESTSRNIIIPMQGEIDSMNVSVAAGILIFEAKRQRDFN